MLHEFLTSNRTELLTRCRSKVAKRFAPSETPAPLDHGVPLFLQQLVETLRFEQRESPGAAIEPEPSPAATEIGRAATVQALNGYASDTPSTRSFTIMGMYAKPSPS